MNDEYRDLLSLPHPTSKKHPRMARGARAAQFSPFAALTGYEEAVEETARLTDGKRALSAEDGDALDRILYDLQTHRGERPRLRATYFQPDARKSGGEERVYTGVLRNLDEPARLLVFYDGTRIPLDDLYTLDRCPDD